MKRMAAVGFALALQGCGLFTSHQTARVLPYGRNSVQVSVDNIPRANFDGRITGSDLRFSTGVGGGIEIGLRSAFGVGRGVDLKIQTSDEESGALPFSTAIGLSGQWFEFSDGENDDSYALTLTASRIYGPVEPYMALRYQYISSRDHPQAFRDHTRHLLIGARYEITSWFFVGLETSYVVGDREDAFVASGMIGFSWSSRKPDEETKGETK